MNKHLWQRVAPMLAKYDEVILGTSSEAGPHVSTVACWLQDRSLCLCVAHTSDHLFNLQSQSHCTVLSPEWIVHGHGSVVAEGEVAPLDAWQVVVRVQPTRLHVLTPGGGSYSETIDFGAFDTQAEQKGFSN